MHRPPGRRRGSTVIVRGGSQATKQAAAKAKATRAKKVKKKDVKPKPRVASTGRKRSRATLSAPDATAEGQGNPRRRNVEADAAILARFLGEAEPKQ